jgi:predicted secreted protein
MTLLTTVFAAIICTIIWYKKAPDSSMQLGTLCLMFWGASIMWFVDAIFEYIELGAEEYFSPAPEDMLNDLFLGLSVTALGLIIWLLVLFIKDPEGRVKAAITKKKKK